MQQPAATSKEPEPAVPWRGRAHLGTGWAVFLGVAGDNHPHAHHAVQIVVAFDAPVTLWTSASGSRVVSVAVVPSDLPHTLLPSDAEVGLLYLDAESAPGRSLGSMSDELWSPPSIDLAPMRSAFEDAIGGRAQGLEHLLTQFAFQSPERQSDERVSSALERLHRSEHLDITASEISAWAHLSPSRFAHRFRLHTGMPLRPYLRWLRLQRAAAAIISGASATDAAHTAGFSDGAHLSRTFRRHFGITPAMLTGLGNR